jgi:Zn-finger nucleic acid-binding protein
MPKFCPFCELKEKKKVQKIKNHICPKCGAYDVEPGYENKLMKQQPWYNK